MEIANRCARTKVRNFFFDLNLFLSANIVLINVVYGSLQPSKIWFDNNIVIYLIINNWSTLSEVKTIKFGILKNVLNGLTTLNNLEQWMNIYYLR